MARVFIGHMAMMNVFFNNSSAKYILCTAPKKLDPLLFFIICTFCKQTACKFRNYIRRLLVLNKEYVSVTH